MEPHDKVGKLPKTITPPAKCLWITSHAASPLLRDPQRPQMFGVSAMHRHCCQVLAISARATSPLPRAPKTSKSAIMISVLQFFCYPVRLRGSNLSDCRLVFSIGCIFLVSIAMLGNCTQHLLRPSPHTTFARSGPHKAFHSSIRSRQSAAKVTAQNSEGSFPDGLINQISVAVTNFSPANAVKKAIAAAQAGQYDEEAVSGKVDAYIRDNPVRSYHCIPRQ